MRKVLCFIIISVMIFSTTSSFALDNRSNNNLIQDEVDQTILLDDGGLLQAILDIDDMEKREKLFDYFYTPAYYKTYSEDAELEVDFEKKFKSHSEQCLKLVEEIIALNSEDFNAIYITMIQDSVNKIVEMDDIVIFVDFVDFVQARAPESIVELNEKCNALNEKATSTEIEIEMERPSEPTRWTYNMSYKAVGSYNSAGTIIASLTTTINWKYETMYFQAYDLTKSSTTYLNPVCYVAGIWLYGILAADYDKTKISWSNGMSFVHVHIARGVWNWVQGMSGNNPIIGYLTTNVKIRGDNQSKTDNSKYMSVQEFARITWL